MVSIWVESLGRSFEHALDLLAAALRDCPPRLWETSMWPVELAESGGELAGPDANLVNDPARRMALMQRWSTPWSVAWHALEVFDYDLNGSFSDWTPPPPFEGHPHWRDVTSLPKAWTQSELLGYIDYCRQLVRDCLATMTDDKAAMPLPAAHRYGGQPYAWVVTSIVGHTTEHASQIRQFITLTKAPPALR